VKLEETVSSFERWPVSLTSTRSRHSSCAAAPTTSCGTPRRWQRPDHADRLGDLPGARPVRGNGRQPRGAGLRWRSGHPSQTRADDDAVGEGELRLPEGRTWTFGGGRVPPGRDDQVRVVTERARGIDPSLGARAHSGGRPCSFQATEQRLPVPAAPGPGYRSRYALEQCAVRLCARGWRSPRARRRGHTSRSGTVCHCAHRVERETQPRHHHVHGAPVTVLSPDSIEWVPYVAG
jgi:hypothetical protein